MSDLRGRPIQSSCAKSARAEYTGTVPNRRVDADSERRNTKVHMDAILTENPVRLIVEAKSWPCRINSRRQLSRSGHPPCTQPDTYCISENKDDAVTYGV